jgi:hypothetical protein
MENTKLISLRNISSSYNIEISFIHSLRELGLVEIVTVAEDECIDEDCLGEVERMMRLHYDLEINMAGIEAIWHLLNRVNAMQQELNTLRNKMGNEL